MAQNRDSAVEAWLQLMAQAIQGTQEAQKAFMALSQSPQAMANFQKWGAQFAPGMEMPTAFAQPETLTEWLETWQKAMGVVPRTRYLELLEKVDALEKRNQKLEETNRQLRAILEGRERQEESTQKMTELWGQMVENSINSQTAWMEAWTKTEAGNESVGEEVTSPCKRTSLAEEADEEE